MCCLAYILQALYFFFFYRKIELGVSYHNSFIENKRNGPNICKKHSWPAASIHLFLLLIMDGMCSLPIIINHAFNSELQWTLHPIERKEEGREGGKKKGRDGWREEGGLKRGRKRDKWKKRKRENRRQKENMSTLATSFFCSFYFIRAHGSHIHIQKCVPVISEVPPGSIMLMI